MNNNPIIKRETESYNQVIDSIHQAVVLERNIRRAVKQSGLEFEERQRIEEEFVSRRERDELNDRYKKELEIQIKLQDDRVEVLERIGRELKQYEETRQKAQEQLLSSTVEINQDGLAKRENTQLLDEGVRQTLMDLSAVRKANLEAMIENNPAWKRFIAPESYVKDTVVAGQNVTALGLAAEIEYKARVGEDFTDLLAAHFEGPGRGLQAALREQNDPREVAKIAITIVDVCDIEFEYGDAPKYTERELAKKVLETKDIEERNELVNAEIRGDAIPLQLALAYIDDSKRDNACIETLKGYGEDTTELERERGLLPESERPEQTVFKLSPREQELAHIARLSLETETPSLAPTIEHGMENSKELQSSLSMEI